MKKYKDKKQYRYRGYDYSQEGFYFVTICLKDRERVFGDIKGGQMHFSEIGRIARNYWQEIPNHFPSVGLDEYTVMPNHIHGIIVIKGDNGGNNGRNAPWRVPTGIQPLVKNSLSSIINHFKGGVKRFCNKNNLDYFYWQPRFHDHIIRNENELNRIRKYIIDNPIKWELDQNNIEDLYM